MKTDLLQALLMEVRHYGSARVHKKVLMWMLGRKNEGEQGWEALLSEWEEVGGTRDDLCLTWAGEEYTLTYEMPFQISKAYKNGWKR